MISAPNSEPETCVHALLSARVKCAAEGKLCCHISAPSLYSLRISPAMFVKDEAVMQQVDCTVLRSSNSQVRNGQGLLCQIRELFFFFSLYEVSWSHGIAAAADQRPHVINYNDYLFCCFALVPCSSYKDKSSWLRGSTSPFLPLQWVGFCSNFH